MQLSAHTYQKAAPVVPGCRERGFLDAPEPSCLPDCSVVLTQEERRRGREGESDGHMVSWGGRHGWCCLVCLCLNDGRQLGGWQAVQFTEILELLRSVQDVHASTPGVGSREGSGRDAHFYGTWLSRVSGQIFCGLSKVKRRVA